MENIEEMLTDSEQRKLEKRRAIEKALKNGRTYDEIKNKYKCSTSTIAAISKKRKEE